MRRIWTVFLLMAAVFVTLPASAALITETIEGNLTGESGSPLDGISGPVTGTAEYDNDPSISLGTGANGGLLFVPSQFILDFSASGGPYLEAGALPATAFEAVSPLIEVNAAGVLLGFDWWIFGLTGFGIYDDPAFNAIDFSAFASTSFFFSDVFENVATGSIRFVRDAQAPAPATAALIGLGFLLAGYRGRRRNNTR